MVFILLLLQMPMRVRRHSPILLLPPHQRLLLPQVLRNLFATIKQVQLM